MCTIYIEKRTLLIGTIDPTVSTILTTTPIGHECVGCVIEGRYTLLRWLGATEQSSVFLTELDGRKAAIKLIPADDAEARLAQWETSGRLSHPHLMQLFDAGRATVAGEDCLYVITEYADEILSDILRERPLSSEEAVELLGPVLETLSFLHGRNILHGHLKPSNLMVVDDRLKLSADRLHYASQQNLAFPSPDPYVAPEVSAARKISTAADLWSLGVVLAETLTQQLPGNGPGNREPVAPESMPAPFFDLARRCLRTDPARRPSLREIEESIKPAQVEDAAITPPRPSRTRVVIAAMLVVVVLMSTVMVIGAHRRAGSTVFGQTSAPSGQAAAPVVESQPAATATQPQRAVAPQQPQKSPAISRPVIKGAVVRGTVVDRVAPDVPEHITDGIHGHFRVGIDVEVDAAGNVGNATIAEPGPSQYFANRALAAARKWKFQPPQASGQAVPSTWTLEFSFSANETTITPRETSP